MKVKTSVSVDDYLLKKAQDRGFNVSGILNDELRKKIQPSRQDVPNGALNLKCTQCGKEIEYGFLCEERNLFLCQECQDNFNMKLCPHDARGEHMHIRIPGLEGQHTDKLK